MVQALKGTQNVQSKVSLPLCPLPGGISDTNSLFISLEVLCASIYKQLHAHIHTCMRTNMHATHILCISLLSLNPSWR